MFRRRSQILRSRWSAWPGYRLAFSTPRRRQLMLIAVLIMTVYTASSLLLQLVKPAPSIATSGAENLQQVSAHLTKKTFNILYWNQFYDRQDYYVGFGEAPFAGCVFSNCRTTSLKSRVHEADAFLFHILNDWEPIPLRLPWQKYVFFLKEPPTLSAMNFSRFEGFFNATMTYRSDSDVVNTYFEVVAGPEKTPLPDITNKTLAVAWIVSQCVTTGGREIYVDLLQKHIDVYMFGKCGESTCPDGERHRCYEAAAKMFHFYLALENSQCEDYITEKFSNALKYGMVPVVMGPDRATYERRAPPNSFIHIDDFVGPQELAEHLRYLISNSTAYAQYFEWRKHYSISSSQGWCNLCRYLNRQSASKSYTTLGRWWFPSCKYTTVVPDSLKSSDNASNVVT